MNAQKARSLLLGGGTAQLGVLVQATLVLLAHARSALDTGEARNARELTKVAERGLQALLRVLTSWMLAGQWAFVRHGKEGAEDVASEAVTKIWHTYLEGEKPPLPEDVENHHPAELVSWVSTVLRNLAIDKHNKHFPKTKVAVPVLPPLPGSQADALSAETQYRRGQILSGALKLLAQYAQERPTVLDGRMTMPDFLLLLVNYGKGEHGLVKEIRESCHESIRPTEQAVRKAIEEVRKQLSERFARLLEDWEDWLRVAQAEGFRIDRDAIDPLQEDMVRPASEGVSGREEGGGEDTTGSGSGEPEESAKPTTHGSGQPKKSARKRTGHGKE